MRLDVSQAIRHPGTEYAFSGEQAIAPQDISGDTVSFDPAKLEGVFSAEENGYVTVRGHLTTVAHTHCANCLAPVAETVRADYDETFVFGGDPEDDEIFVYTGSVIDLERLTVSYTLLQLPMRFLCREDCDGMEYLPDPDVNVCLCQKELPGQHPFAALQRLLAEKAGKSDD